MNDQMLWKLGSFGMSKMHDIKSDVEMNRITDYGVTEFTVFDHVMYISPNLTAFDRFITLLFVKRENNGSGNLMLRVHH